MKVLFSPAAREDLTDILRYIAADDAERALTFVLELEAACAILSDFPLTGAARLEVAEGLRSKPYGRYIIFYRVLDASVRIERFLHSARDPGPLRA